MQRLILLLLTLAIGFAGPLAMPADACAGSKMAAARCEHAGSRCCCPPGKCGCASNDPAKGSPAPHDEAPPGPAGGQVHSKVLSPAISVLQTPPAAFSRRLPGAIEASGLLAPQSALRLHLQLSILRV